jgi:transposase
MPVKYKTKEQQEVAYLHKARQNTIQQRIQRSNSLITSLFEFGFLVECGKTQFAKDCKEFVKDAFDEGFITNTIFDQMEIDCEEIKNLIDREKKLDKLIVAKNKKSDKAILLETIPGIGPINASILSNKSTEPYSTPKDFAASLGLVPKQNTTGGKIVLGRITKQGDRYARTMLIQAGRSLLMRSFKDNVPAEPIFGFIARLKEKEKGFNVITVAVANKLARIAYACMTQNVVYEA